MRLLVHWQDFPGYGADCLEAFRRRYGGPVLVLFDQVNEQVDYRRGDFPFRGDMRDISDASLFEVDGLVADFEPDMCIVGGWRGYALRIAMAAARRDIPVVATSDNTGTSRIRRVGLCLYRRALLRHLHEGYWVPGRRARRYLETCGFPPAEIREGFYSVRTDRYAPNSGSNDKRGGILFVGRLAGEKGIPELLEGFRRYEGDWKLRICGTGPLEELVEEHTDADPRVESLGFVQPEDVAEEMKNAAALVLPSRREPWGVAILEGAAAALPVVCTEACGASEDLIEDGVNGYVIPAPADPGDLAAIFEQLEDMSARRRRAMGERSRVAAKDYDAGRWAEKLHRWARELAA